MLAPIGMGMRVQRGDVAFLVQLEQIGVVRVIVRMRKERRVGVARSVDIEHPAQIHVEIRVAIEDDERVAELWQRVVQRTSGPARHSFQCVAERYALRGSVAEMRANDVVAVMDEQEDPDEAVTPTERESDVPAAVRPGRAPSLWATDRCAI